MNFDFRFYFSLFLRRLPIMLTLFFICTALGLSAAFNQSPTYQSTAKLLVEEAQIDTASDFGADPDQQLQLVRERLLTRANLIDVANKYDVFEDMREMNPDEVVDQMFQSTSIHQSGGRNAVTSMTISFEARTGQTAANVVNEYLTMIRRADSSNQITQIENELSFFTQEVDRLGTDLDLQSALIVKFKDDNAEALPGNLEYRYGRQSLLQERLAGLEREKSAVEDQKDDVVRLYESTGQVNRPRSRELTNEEVELASLELELESARAVYTDTNPKVVLLRSRVEQLKQVVGRLVPTKIDDQFGGRETSLLELRLAEIDSRLGVLTEEKNIVIAEVEELENSIAATASNAIELNALERDFENIQNRYNTAVASLDQARFKQRLILSSQAQKITVLEGANTPQEPSGPSRIKVAAVGVGVGLLLAAGFFALLELTNRTIRRPAEIESRFNVTPIAAIPYMESQSQKLIRRSLLALALLVVLTGVPAALWYVDKEHMPLENITIRIMDRIGF